MKSLQKIESSTELDSYNPEKGLKNIAVAESAERYFARAKDASQLYEAIELKLKEQRRFVLWWDTAAPKQQGARTPRRNRSVTPLEAGKNGIPERMVIQRWRDRLKSDKDFAAALEAAQEKCRRICEVEKGAVGVVHGTQGTGENEWYTPEQYIVLARNVLGDFDLDPASCATAQQTVKAKAFFTKEDNGLTKEWHGRVWLNPPYAQPLITHFIEKLVSEHLVGAVPAAILLTNNYTDTQWFDTAVKACSAICFTRGRIKFWSPTGGVPAPIQGQAFFYFGPDVAQFDKEFKTIGNVLIPSSTQNRS